MRQRLGTVVLTAIVAGAVGAGVAIYTKQSAHMLGIRVITALVGFALVMIFRFRLV